MKRNQSKITLSLNTESIKRGRIMSATRGISFSQLVSQLINENYDIKSIKDSILKLSAEEFFK